MEVILKLKDPAYGNNKDAWSLIWISLDPGSARKGWTEANIQKDLANGEIRIPFPDDKEGKKFVKALVDRGGLSIYIIE